MDTQRRLFTPVSSVIGGVCLFAGLFIGVLIGVAVASVDGAENPPPVDSPRPEQSVPSGTRVASYDDAMRARAEAMWNAHHGIGPLIDPTVDLWHRHCDIPVDVLYRVAASATKASLPPFNVCDPAEGYHFDYAQELYQYYWQATGRDLFEETGLDSSSKPAP